MSVFVGVDQALRKLGVAVIVDGQMAVLTAPQTPEKLKGAPRLAWLSATLRSILKPYTHADATALEGQSFGSISREGALGEISGVVQVVLLELYKEPPLVVPPTTLKRFVTGSGNATKKIMRRATMQYWGLDIPNDDCCDAHGLARFAEAHYTSSARLKHQVDVIRKFNNPKRRNARRVPSPTNI